MKRTLKYYRIMWWRHDLAAGLSVFLVALPLCLGIALASGAPLYAGLLSGIIGGLIVAPLSGSSLSVSGPAAGLTTLVAAAIVSLGDYRIFLLSLVVAGLFQILVGTLKWGGIANFFPSSVIKGMLAAIGIILISKQIPLALGYDQPDFWTSGFVQLFSADNFLGNISRFSHHISVGAMVIAGASLMVMILVQHPSAHRFKAVPAPLAAVVGGITLNFLFGAFVPAWALDKNQLVTIPADFFAEITFPDFSKMFSTAEIWKNGALIGILATLETLLCVEAVDKLDRQNRITPVNRELVAQGVGNIFCGLLGAIPLTAVVVRGAANVDAGGRTKMSAVTHGILMLLAVLLIPFALNLIPYASLAAVLLVTGYNLTKPKLYRNMWSLKGKQFVPFIITVIIILMTDLLIGVSIGLLISVYFIIQNNFKAEYRISKQKFQGIETEVIRLNSNVTFLNKMKLKKILDEVAPYTVLTIDGSDCNFIDYDILEIISEYDRKAKDRHIELHLINIEKVNITALH